MFYCSIQEPWKRLPDKPPVMSAAATITASTAWPRGGLIVAGSDADNDGSICDPGKACGGYPLLSQLRPMMVGDNKLSGLEFSNCFELVAPARAPLEEGVRRALD
jgi:hypothetical protein